MMFFKASLVQKSPLGALAPWWNGTPAFNKCGRAKWGTPDHSTRARSITINKLSWEKVGLGARNFALSSCNLSFLRFSTSSTSSALAVVLPCRGREMTLEQKRLKRLLG